MERLNIFVDETGEFGFGKNASRLYGVSFTFHEQSDDISIELGKLNDRLQRIGYTDMIHMADLIMRRGYYSDFEIKTRKSIFNSIYQFSRKIKVRYKTIIVDKKYVDSGKVLKYKLANEIDKMIIENGGYFNKFDRIVMYYDNGQEILGTILDTVFNRFEGYLYVDNFNHKEKRLFQVSDMLTYIDKYDYKYKHNIPFTKGEKYFFGEDEIRRVLKELNKRGYN